MSNLSPLSLYLSRVVCFVFCSPLSLFSSVYAELMFLETSALTGENVEEGFLKCARTILNKIDSGTLLSFVKDLCVRVCTRWLVFT